MSEEYQVPEYVIYHKATRSILDVHVIDFRHGVIGHEGVDMEGEMVFKTVSLECNLLHNTGFETGEGQVVYDGFVLLDVAKGSHEWEVQWNKGQGQWIVDNGLPISQMTLSLFLGSCRSSYVVGHRYQDEYEREKTLEEAIEESTLNP